MEEDTKTPITTSDIAAKGLIARLPEPWRSYGRLARLDRPAGTWLLFLPGIFGLFLPPLIASNPSLALRFFYAFLFLPGALLMRSAGCVINDMWDRKIDAHVARTAMRPLASGSLKMRQAWLMLFFLLLGGLLILLALPSRCWALAPVALILVALYPLAKRFTRWPQLVMGFTFGFAAPMGFVASTGGALSTLPWPILGSGLCLYGGVILWQLGFDTIYGFQDIEDDARIGVKSSSQVVVNFARPFIFCCYSAALFLFGASAFLAQLRGLFLLFFLPAAFLLVLQAWQLAPHKATACLAAFRANRLIGWLLAVGFVLGRLQGCILPGRFPWL